MRTRVIPAWTLGWRLRLAAEHAGLSQSDIAVHYGVDRNTVGRWWHDERKRWTPRDLADYADICDVPVEWLVTGEPSINESAALPATNRAEVEAAARADLRRARILRQPGSQTVTETSSSDPGVSSDASPTVTRRKCDATD